MLGSRRPEGEEPVPGPVSEAIPEDVPSSKDWGAHLTAVK